MERTRLSGALVLILIFLAAAGSGAACLGDLCACGRCDGGHQMASAQQEPSCHQSEPSRSHETGCLCLDAATGSPTPAATLIEGSEVPTGASTCHHPTDEIQAPTPVETDMDLRRLPLPPASLFSLNSSFLL